MQIFVAGGSGYIGSYLCRFFLNNGHHVSATGRRRHHPLSSHDHFTYIRADTTKKGLWQESLQTAEVVINLAGRTIFKHWTDRYKEKIHYSRISTTQNIAAAIPREKQVVFCSASAVGYYGDQGDELLTESSSAGDDFLAGVSRDWEAAAMAIHGGNTRVVLTRFGIILSRDGGAMARMIPAFKFFLGGALGSGGQWFPWMHLADVAEAVDFVIKHPEISGPVNFCAPNPVRNRELTRMLARALDRPALISVPPFALRLFLGEFGETLLASQRALPEKLIQNGYAFKFDRIENAIVEMLKTSLPSEKE